MSPSRRAEMQKDRCLKTGGGGRGSQENLCKMISARDVQRCDPGGCAFYERAARPRAAAARRAAPRRRGSAPVSPCLDRATRRGAAAPPRAVRSSAHGCISIDFARPDRLCYRVLRADKMRSWTFMDACQRYMHCSEYVLILLACIGSRRGRSGTDLEEHGCPEPS